MSDSNVETWSSGSLLRVAEGQRRILMLILAGFLLSIPLGIFVLSAPPRRIDTAFFIVRLVALGFGVAQLFAVWKLAKALRSSVPWLYCLLAFVPVIALFSLLYLNQSATRVLTANGIPVGFLGANVDNFRFREVSFGPDECNVCGKYLKNAYEQLECPKCRVKICDSCSVRSRVGAGMVESFTVACPRCKTELVEKRTSVPPVEEDFGDDDS